MEPCTVTVEQMMAAALREPTADERRAYGEAWYERAGPTFLDQWPTALTELAPSTTLIPWPMDILEEFYDTREFSPAVKREVLRLSDAIDAACDWSGRYIRLNSRSPKDAAPQDDGPFTCAGRQALFWIRGSERCLDDLARFQSAQRPAFIAVREPVFGGRAGEYRTFVRDGELIGAAQYHRDAAVSAEARDRTWSALLAYHREALAPRLHLRDVVVDVIFEGMTPRLLEINPYGQSDPVAAGSYDNVETGPPRMHWYGEAPPDER